jgi:hypothetical protein
MEPRTMHGVMARWSTGGLPTAEFECEVVLREEEDQSRIAHSFSVMVEPGTCVRMEGRDWTVIEVRERRSERPEVICSPAK